MELRSQGITDLSVLNATERVPRELFVPETLRGHAYDTRALPIPSGQSISQPYVVAYMTQALKLNDRHKVLEVGTGSGYQAAILAETLELECHAGHGLSYDNVTPVAAITNLTELNIGHFLVGEAIFLGLGLSIQKMRDLIDASRSDKIGSQFT